MMGVLNGFDRFGSPVLLTRVPGQIDLLHADGHPSVVVQRRVEGRLGLATILGLVHGRRVGEEQGVANRPELIHWVSLLGGQEVHARPSFPGDGDVRGEREVVHVLERVVAHAKPRSAPQEAAVRLHIAVEVLEGDAAEGPDGAK